MPTSAITAPRGIIAAIAWRRGESEGARTRRDYPPGRARTSAHERTPPRALTTKGPSADASRRSIDGMVAKPHGDDVGALAAAGDGDPSGLLQLFDTYGPLLFGVAQRILGDRSLAEDVVRDVFLEIWGKAASFAGGGASVQVWLLMHLRARALERHRARTGKMVSLDDTQISYIVTEEEERELGPARAQVQRVIDLLPPKQRNMLQLAYFEGLSSAQIADRTKVPTTRVPSEIAAAIDALRAALEAGDVGGAT